MAGPQLRGEHGGAQDGAVCTAMTPAENVHPIGDKIGKGGGMTTRDGGFRRGHGDAGVIVREGT
jgi:hypothetical protein